MGKGAMLGCFILFLYYAGCSPSGGVSEGNSPVAPARDSVAQDPPAPKTAWDEIPNLVICKPISADPFVYKSETGFDQTFFQSCAEVCTDFNVCMIDNSVRGRAQKELYFVVDEDGNGNGFGGTLVSAPFRLFSRRQTAG